MRCDGGHRNDSPCLDCPERIAGCHDRCKRFKAWRQGVDEVNANRKKYYQNLGIRADPNFTEVWTRSGQKLKK